MKNWLKRILAQLGIRNAYDQARHERYLALKQQLDHLPARSTDASCELIVFSKDRAMQLDALLRSYYHYCQEPLPLTVLYSVSSPEYHASYQQLQELYAHHALNFVEEQSFKADLSRVFDQLSSAKVLFLVDDILFKRQIDLKSFAAIDTQSYIPSLRLGQHLSYAYTLQQAQALPGFDSSVAYPDMLSWDYAQARGDWAYPLSVDGNLFDTQEMKVMVNALDYKAPNSFEEALQLLSPYYARRRGLCYAESVIVNNPCNKVQVENDNVAGEISIEDLDQKWKAGFRIAFEDFRDLKNISAHQELSYRFVKR